MKYHIIPYAPSPSASSFGIGFVYLNTFSQGIWSTRELYDMSSYVHYAFCCFTIQILAVPSMFCPKKTPLDLVVPAVSLSKVKRV